MNTENVDNSSGSRATTGANDRGHQRVWLLSVALLGLGGFFLFQRQGQTPPAANRPAGPPAIPVAIANAQQGDINDYVNALGYVTPVYTVTVRTRVDGELLKVNYREGQVVRQGEVLAEIDPRPYQAQLTQAEGQLERDQALLNQARIDLERYREAYAKNAIAQQQVEIQQATVYQYEGTVKIDRGQVESARINLLYCTVKSPITGRVGLRLVDPGNIVHSGDANGLLVITQFQPMTVVFSIAEDQLPRLQSQLRRKERLKVDALDRTQQNVLANGNVSALDNQIDATTGTVRLRAVFSNQNGVLFPNQFVNTRLLIGTERGVTLIPTAAIQYNGDVAFVYVVKPDQTVTMRNVTVGTSDGNITAAQGVTTGEPVVTDGFDRLQEGAKVVVRGNQQTGGGTQQGNHQREERKGQQ